jgi:hypothetical protein
MSDYDRGLAVRREVLGDSYVDQAEILASGLAGDQDGEARATAAGREWGRKLKPPPPSTTGPPDAEESIAHLVGLLDELGLPRSVAETTKSSCGTARFWSWRKASGPSSVRPTWGSCAEHWKPGRHRSRPTGWTPSSSRICAWYTSLGGSQRHEPRAGGCRRG